MAAGYNKQFLIDAFLHRFVQCSLITLDQLDELEVMANKFYDEVGKDKFRVYASLDAEAIRKFKLDL